jgi:hypothetical protein
MDGTSLDDLDYSSAGTSDRDLVRDILHIANNTNTGGGASMSGPGGRPPLPTLSTRNPGGMQNLPPPSGNTMDIPNPNSFQQHSMDPGPYQAHVIGNSQPTPADFANLMQASQYSGGGGNLQPPMDARYMQQQPQQYIQQPSNYNASNYPQQFGGTSWMSTIIKEAKIPLFVAILVFIVNLPIFNILISHSLPSLISVAGGLTSSGIIVKSLMAGFLFWIVQRVLAPLVVE